MVNFWESIFSKQSVIQKKTLKIDNDKYQSRIQVDQWESHPLLPLYSHVTALFTPVYCTFVCSSVQEWGCGQPWYPLTWQTTSAIAWHSDRRRLDSGSSSKDTCISVNYSCPGVILVGLLQLTAGWVYFGPGGLLSCFSESSILSHVPGPFGWDQTVWNADFLLMYWALKKGFRIYLTLPISRASSLFVCLFVCLFFLLT